MNRICIIVMLCLLAVSCSTTSHIPDDDQLFVGLSKIDYQGATDDQHFFDTQAEIEAALATAPNGALFGSSYYRTPFPYRLWIWNWTEGSNGKFKQWLNKSFGKPPVLLSQVSPALRASVAKSVLRNNGYLHGDVNYTTITQSNPKKAKIGYQVTLNDLFVVDTMSYEHFPTDMQLLIDSTRADAYIEKGAPFTVQNLDAERTRLTALMRNNGYYYYQPNFASYLADTFDVANRVKLRLQLADSVPAEGLKPWYIGTTTMQLRRSFMERPDTTMGRRFLKISFSGKRPPIRPRVILRDLKLRPRQLFSYDNYMESLQKLNANDIFSSVDFVFTPRKNVAATEKAAKDTLDLTINCTFDKPYDFYIEGNFINRTIGRLGPELRMGVTRRNAFRSGEKLDINLHGSHEWQTSGMADNMNSYQYGADASIEFPRILFPRLKATNSNTRNRRNRFRRRFFATPSTLLKVSGDVVRRPNYYKMNIFSAEWTYRWQPSATSRHELSPLTLKYQHINTRTERFDSLLSLNPYLLTTMDNMFIPKMRYTYTYASPKGTANPIRWETTVEEAGNLTALYVLVVQGNAWNKQGKTLLRNVYSQFLRIETDFTKTWQLSQKEQLVAHLNYGLLWSYGNSTEAPFSELFYVGGANSIRAFPVRSIGPGAFPGVPGNNQFSYLMQNGDVKLVMNLEYRRRLFGNLYGALFLDAGNVWNSADWSVSESDATASGFDASEWNSITERTRFKASRILNEIATGTGIGLRYDLDFLIVRVDWGFGLHLPYDTGKSGYFNIPRFRDMHTLHLAIGYPF